MNNKILLTIVGLALVGQAHSSNSTDSADFFKDINTRIKAINFMPKHSAPDATLAEMRQTLEANRKKFNKSMDKLQSIQSDFYAGTHSRVMNLYNSAFPLPKTDQSSQPSLAQHAPIVSHPAPLPLQTYTGSSTAPLQDYKAFSTPAVTHTINPVSTLSSSGRNATAYEGYYRSPVSSLPSWQKTPRFSWNSSNATQPSGLYRQILPSHYSAARLGSYRSPVSNFSGWSSRFNFNNPYTARANTFRPLFPATRQSVAAGGLQWSSPAKGLSTVGRYSMPAPRWGMDAASSVSRKKSPLFSYNSPVKGGRIFSPAR